MARGEDTGNDPNRKVDKLSLLYGSLPYDLARQDKRQLDDAPPSFRLPPRVKLDEPGLTRLNTIDNSNNPAPNPAPYTKHGGK